MIAILVSGKAGVGKSTFSNYLSEFLKSNKVKAEVISFASPIKKMAKDCFHWDGKKDAKGRVLLQSIGKTGRDYNEDIWASEAYDNACGDACIVDDWRFPNELRLAGEVFEMTFACRIISPHREILKGTAEYNDVSETSLQDQEKYDIIIYNSEDVSLDILRQIAEVVGQEIMQRLQE